ncbi:MAG TPA: hypothetical protein VHK06_04865 [Candidatus Limnocylindria bacterium]|nr:hypothetical protein [Candidatus Limnocylindria bacterium]
MRAVDCPCGEHLTARNDGQLLEAAKAHNSSDHDNQYSETELRVLVDTAAYDERGE